MRYLAIFLCVWLFPSCQKSPNNNINENHLLETTRYTGAYIFNGNEFIARDLCVYESNVVQCGHPKHKQKVVDLDGLYITPPFGDAHTHHFDSPYTFDWHNSIAIDSGIFYAMTMTTPTNGVKQIKEKLSDRRNVDVASSLGGITGPESHPAEVYEALALNIRSPEEKLKRLGEIKKSSKYADDAYFVVTDEDSVRQKLDMLLANKPDHIKVFLRSSDRYHENWGKWGPGGGIDPKLLPLIAKISHDNGLRLAVANSNVADFRESLKVRANIVTHLPCYQDTETDVNSEYYQKQTSKNCLISSEEAQSAANIGLISTLITTEWSNSRPDKIVDWEKLNVKQLKNAGAILVVATNNYGATLTDGLINGVDKGFFGKNELLKIATMDTPKAIFPQRKVGCLNNGCEASFIGFEDNPLKSFNAIKTIKYRLKEGIALNNPLKKITN